MCSNDYILSSVYTSHFQSHLNFHQFHPMSPISVNHDCSSLGLQVKRFSRRELSHQGIVEFVFQPVSEVATHEGNLFHQIGNLLSRQPSNRCYMLLPYSPSHPMHLFRSKNKLFRFLGDCFFREDVSKITGCQSPSSPLERLRFQYSIHSP